MVKPVSRTIVLKGTGHEMNEGIVSNAAIAPGALVMLHTDGTIRNNATADRRPGAQVAVEYELNGQGIDTPYAIGDRVKYVVLTKGQEFRARVAAAATAIAVGARLTAGLNGTVKNSAAANDDAFIALEAVNNSAGGTEVFINVRVV